MNRLPTILVLLLVCTLLLGTGCSRYPEGAEYIPIVVLLFAFFAVVAAITDHDGEWKENKGRFIQTWLAGIGLAALIATLSLLACGQL